MKRVFIVHRWDGKPEGDWYPWLKRELEKKDFLVTVPAMPEPDEPKMETWIPYLADVVGHTDGETYFVGHSIGCQTIIRYLETLSADTRIGGAVFVAGWYNLRNLETEEEERIAGPWVITPHDDEKLKKILKNKSVAIFSDNDPFVMEENKEQWRKNVGAEIIVEHKKGHFSESDGIKELPIVLEKILSL